MSKYVIIQRNEKGEEHTYTKKHDTLEDAVKFLKKIEEYYSKSKEKIIWYDCEVTHGDLMYFDDKNNTLDDWYSNLKWRIEKVSDNDEKEDIMLKKYIHAYADWLKENEITVSDYDINVEFIDFLFEFADLGFDKKELETNTHLINALVGVAELAGTWIVGNEKEIVDGLWTSLYKRIYNVKGE